jgi:hypothetical protein
MSLKNSLVRFGVEEDTGKVFCYLTSRHLEAKGLHICADGVWDLAKVKKACLEGLNIHTALVKMPKQPEVDKVDQANEDFKKTVDETAASAAPPAAAADPVVQPTSGEAAPAA